MKRNSIPHWIGVNALSLCGLLFVSLIALFVGEKFFFSFPSQWTPEERDIFLLSRLPRVLLAAVTGMALGSSGTAFQGLLQNSLADPYILGVSSGAALGSIVGLLFGIPTPIIPVVAFGTSLLAMLVVYRIAAKGHQLNPHSLLLTGVILNAFLFSFILVLNGLATFEKSQKILYLLIGNLENESFQRIAVAFVLVAAALIILTLEGHALNLLSAGKDVSQSLGLDPHIHRRRIFFAASLMVGAIVPLAGLIGFVGLFVPHITRAFVGNDHRYVLPVSAWVGGILLVVCDTVARTLLIRTSFQSELPVGAVTALLGAPFFLFLMRKKGGS